jgi:hypothetical protein
MRLDLILLLIGASFKIVILSILTTLLWKKWNLQEKKYFTDFPFLTGLAMFLFFIAKFVDIWFYVTYPDNQRVYSSTANDILLALKIRLIFSPILSIAPYFLLMMIIWFEGKRKIQISLGGLWFLISFLMIILPNDYATIQSRIPIIILPPLILSVITYFIIHNQKRLSQINSLMLGISWILFIIAQMIRPSLQYMVTGTYGFLWIAEIIESIPLIGIGLGYMNPAIYANKDKKILIKKEDQKNDTEIKTH